MVPKYFQNFGFESEALDPLFFQNVKDEDLGAVSNDERGMNKAISMIKMNVVLNLAVEKLLEFKASAGMILFGLRVTFSRNLLINLGYLKANPSAPNRLDHLSIKFFRLQEYSIKSYFNFDKFIVSCLSIRRAHS